MLGIVVGVVVANAAEWVAHRHILHGLGKRKASFWSFHWHEHHGAARRNDHVDDAYRSGPFAKNAQAKETWVLVGIGLAITPMIPFTPWFVGTLWTHGLLYYTLHRRSHLDPEFARRWLPWHYDHHMGPDQNANWCVTWPLFDWIMGTRKVYFGTEREQTDRARRQARLAQQAQGKRTPVSA